MFMPFSFYIVSLPLSLSCISLYLDASLSWCYLRFIGRARSKKMNFLTNCCSLLIPFNTLFLFSIWPNSVFADDWRTIERWIPNIIHIGTVCMLLLWLHINPGGNWTQNHSRAICNYNGRRGYRGKNNLFAWWIAHIGSTWLTNHNSDTVFSLLLIAPLPKSHVLDFIETKHKRIERWNKLRRKSKGTIKLQWCINDFSCRWNSNFDKSNTPAISIQ